MGPGMGGHNGSGGGGGGSGQLTAATQQPPEIQHPVGRRLRRLATAVVAVLVVCLLLSAGYGFVVKSIPYQTPQLTPPQVRLTAQDIGSFEGYPQGLREAPVLTWRDVSHRVGNLVTTPARFATQLAMLRRTGFRSISAATLAALGSGRPVALPPRPVLLTFDDGLSTDWTTVDPILRRYGFTAVVFIDPADVALKSPSYFLSRGELQAMVASGRWDVGEQFQGTRRSGAAAATRAQSELESVVGRPVTAYAWPVSDVRSTRASQAPAVQYRALKESFPEVFGRPAEGPADFVIRDSAAGPLPRMNITAKDTLHQMSVRLRTGVQAPPPPDPLTLPWHSMGGTCLVSRQTVRLAAEGFALCAPVANGKQWRDYQLRLSVAAPADVTAIIELRVSTSGRIEIAIGRNGVSVKQQIGRRWLVLRQVMASTYAAPDGSVPSLVGEGSLPVTVQVTGSLLRLQAGPVIIRQLLSPKIENGVIAVGLISPHPQRSVTYSQPVIVTASRQ